MDQDEKMGRDINFARFVGRERAYGVFEEEMRSFDQELRELKLDTPSFQKMQQMLRHILNSFLGLWDQPPVRLRISRA